MKKIAIIMGASLMSMTGMAHAETGSDIKAYIESHPEIIRDVLVQHPEYLEDAGRALQENSRMEMIAKYATSVKYSKAHVSELSQVPAGYFGDRQAKNMLVEFFDYQCHFCRQSEPVVQQYLAKHPDTIIITREVSVISTDSDYANQVAIAAGLIGQKEYVSVHQALMKAPMPLTHDAVDTAVMQSGVSKNEIDKKIASGQPKKILSENQELFKQLGAIGTPSFITPGKGLLPGFSSLSKLEQYKITENPSDQEIDQIEKAMSLKNKGLQK